MFAILGLLLFGLTACQLKTPEIKGMVLDAETKQPVREAWVHATMQIKSKTIQGDVTTVLRVEPPHTRSNQKGEFVVPAKEFSKPGFPVSFWTEIENFSVSASTIDDKSGGSYLKEYEGKKEIDVVIHVKPWEEGLKDDREYFSYIQSLYSYCISGRFGVEVPSVEGGCDKWELDFAITKHEILLKKIAEPKSMDQRIQYVGAMKQLAYLYKRKKEYKRALDLFLTIRDFDAKRKMDLWLKEYEIQIKELQKLLQGNQK